MEQKKVLFIDRDGTLILEPNDFQIDDLSKLVFFPDMIYWLRKIVEELNYKLVMVSNQDGLGTPSFPEDKFYGVQNFIIETLKNEKIIFEDVHIDRSFEHDNLPTRKPGIGMLGKYFSESYNLKNSFVIGDRSTDMVLAKNLGCGGIFIQGGHWHLEGVGEGWVEVRGWQEIYEFLKKKNGRQVEVKRHTNETKIDIKLNLDGEGKHCIKTGLHFFDHMLEQLSKHSFCDLEIVVNGDLEIDEHHTIEDTGISLGEAFKKALGNKLGIERYGYALPMDDAFAVVGIDFGGRPWVNWDVVFKREYVGDLPTEMVFHFFKSFCDAGACNLYVKCEGENEHHKIEAIFKCFAKAIKAAVKRDSNHLVLPSTKGIL